MGNLSLFPYSHYWRLLENIIKIENNSKFAGKLSLQDFFVVFVASFPKNYILYKYQFFLRKTDENTLNI